MVASVEELLRYPFHQRSFQEQRKIIAEGPPRPLIQNKETEEIDPKKGLRGGIFDIETWLCGCDVRNAFFCWTCLLFVKGNQGLPPGFKPDGHLKQNMKIHKKSPDHLSGMLHHQIFQSNMVATPQDEVDKFFEKNREVLETILDIVCMMLPQTTPESVRANYLNLQSQCVQLLNFMKISDSREIVDEACSLIKAKDVVSDIVGSLANLVKNEFKNELKLCNFVSIILSGHVEVQTDLKLSIVVRYVKSGRAVERLIGFASINKYLMDIIEFVRQLVFELGISEKQFAISCDGIVLPTHLLNDFFSWLRTYHPKSFFVPCHFHEFHLVLQQTLSSAFSECCLFFRTLRSLKDYLGRMRRPCPVLDTKAGMPLCLCFKDIKLSDTQFLRVIKQNRMNLIRFLKTAGDESYTCAKFECFEALGFFRWLQDFQSVFLLEIFFVLFKHTAFMNEMLNSNSPDSVFEWGVINDTLDSLRRFRLYDFEKFYKHFTTLMRPEQPKQASRLLFERIVHHVIETIELRFKQARNLNFLGIFDFENRDNFIVSDYHLNSLNQLEFKFIPVLELATEMKVMNEYGWLTGRMSVFELVDILHQNNLQETLKNVFRLAEFIVSLPCKPVCPSVPDTKLDSINTWTSCLKIPGSESLTLICEERDCLENLTFRADFPDEVFTELKAYCKKKKLNK